MNKFNSFLISLILLSLPGIIIAQESKANVRNIDFSINEMDQSIEVTYDIVNSSPIEEFSIMLAFVDDNDFYIYPTFVKGDVGPGVKGGKDKRIIWEYSNEDVYLGRIKAIIYTESVTLSPRGAGYGLVSLAVPGLGDQYVSYTKNRWLRPVYITISAYGLVGLGIVQKIRSDQLYEDYNESLNPNDFKQLYNQANNLHHQSLIFFSIGAGIWLGDVLWVTLKGLQNSKNSDKSNYAAHNHLMVYPNPYGGLNIGCQITF